VTGIEFSKDLLEMKDEALKRWFMVDQFAMFSQLARDKNQPVTATQIWQMIGEKATLLSPAIETHSKYLKTVDDRMIDIAERSGRPPFDPDTIANITDVVVSTLGRNARTIGVNPVFVGPLAQAQKVSQVMQPIQATMEAVAPIIEIWPELRHKYRSYELAGKIEDAQGFPQDVIKPKEEYEEDVAAEAAAIAQQQQLENSIEMAKASKDVSGPVDETSVMANVAGAIG
jgi:hypothetical protein